MLKDLHSRERRLIHPESRSLEHGDEGMLHSSSFIFICATLLLFVVTDPSFHFSHSYSFCL